ncbi:MAG: beta-lactamase family protein [Anaerolineaceae bacterium]|nr:beta-lactamase family protein [Anaerolineaceae bacterium]
MKTSLPSRYENKAPAIEALFDSFDNKDLAGGYAAAVMCEGQVLFRKAYGFANHEFDVPFTTQTVFDFASVAKQFTGFCMADLILQGALSLDDLIREYIPELPEYEQKITIRHLLGHTSGLRDWYPMIKLAGYSEDDTIRPEFLMNLICRQKSLNFSPGSQYAYSNSGYFLLAQLVKRLNGKFLREYADEKIFKPLAMDATFFADDPDEIVSNRAFPYLEGANHKFGQGSNRLAAPGCSSLFSSLEDMTLWMQSVDAGITDQDPHFALMLQPTPLNDGRKVSYNFGIAKGRWHDHVCLGHGGGWNAFACDVSYFPEERIAIIFITNRSPNYVNTSEALRGILFEEPENPQTPPTQDKVEDEQLPLLEAALVEDFSGEYFSDEVQTAYTIHAENGHLRMSHLVNEDVRLCEKEPDVFSGDKYWCEEITFTRDEQGAVDGFLLSANAGNLMKNIRFLKLKFR